MTCAQLRTKTRTPISRKICRVKLGFQILNAVEQLSSLFSKDKLKQGAHIHHTPNTKRDVPARPRVGVCVPLALGLHYFQCFIALISLLVGTKR